MLTGNNACQDVWSGGRQPLIIVTLGPESFGSRKVSAGFLIN
jgi:hypothetical protein